MGVGVMRSYLIGTQCGRDGWVFPTAAELGRVKPGKNAAAACAKIFK